MIAVSIASNIDLTGVDSAGLVSVTITILKSCQKGDTVEPPGGILNGSGISAIDARHNTLNRYYRLSVVTVQVYEDASPQFNSIPTTRTTRARYPNDRGMKRRVPNHAALHLF